MGPLEHLDVTASELGELVQGAVWQRWVAAEPALAALASLFDLRQLRGPEADQLLGALVRLAAKDGWDDELAARAVARQLAGEAIAIAIELRDLGPDVDQVVLASLWMEIRCFPWRNRTRAYATSLRRTTKRSALQHLRYTPAERTRLVLKPPEDFSERSLIGMPSLPDGATAAQSRAELTEYLEWCVGAGWITGRDAALTLELVAAGWQTADRGTLRLKRGVCSMHAVEVVAQRRGVCAKTIVRERDRVLSQLREAAGHYFREVA